MRVCEREGLIAGECDPLARGPQRHMPFACRRERRGLGCIAEPVEIDAGCDGLSDGLEFHVEIVRFDRLHEAEVPLGKRERLIAIKGTQNGNADRFHVRSDERLLAWACNAIEDDTAECTSLR